MFPAVDLVQQGSWCWSGAGGEKRFSGGEFAKGLSRIQIVLGIPFSCYLMRAVPKLVYPKLVQARDGASRCKP